MARKVITHSVDETIEVGKSFASQLKAGDVVCLKGDLGSGKTHFVKGIAAGLNIPEEEIHSPTFALIHEHEGKLPLYHFDFYRLETEKETLEIGAEEYFYGEGVSVIEWPDKILSVIPDGAIWIRFESDGKNQRTLFFENQEQEA